MPKGDRKNWLSKQKAATLKGRWLTSEQGTAACKVSVKTFRKWFYDGCPLLPKGRKGRVHPKHGGYSARDVARIVALLEEARNGRPPAGTLTFGQTCKRLNCFRKSLREWCDDVEGGSCPMLRGQPIRTVPGLQSDKLGRVIPRTFYVEEDVERALSASADPKEIPVAKIARQEKAGKANTLNLVLREKRKRGRFKSLYETYCPDALGTWRKQYVLNPADAEELRDELKLIRASQKARKGELPAKNGQLPAVRAEAACRKRDERWQEWRDEGRTLPGIRNAWNALTDAERCDICPTAANRLPTGRTGSDQVKAALRRLSRHQK